MTSSPPHGLPTHSREVVSRLGRIATLCLWASSAAACFDQMLAPGFESDGRVEVTNDEATLDDRVGYPDDDIPIDAPTTAPGLAGSPALAPSSVRLTLVGEVDPPVVNGQALQATSIWVARLEDRTVVSYAVAGSPQLGGLDHFTKLLNKRPKLSSALTFADADVNAVFTDGSYAYAATATTDTSFTFPAVLERIVISGDKFRIDPGNRRLPLESFAGTSSTSTDDVVYATSGDDGGVYAFDAATTDTLGSYPLDDARWVALDEPNGRIVVLQGTPGRLAVFAEGVFPMTPIATYSVPGVDVAESKSTVEVLGGKAFVAAGPDGVQVVCLDDGSVVGNVPRPDPATLGLSPSVVVTNAVAVEGDLMFISNGEAGVYAAAGAESFETSACSAPQSISVLGRLRFDDLQSVNHVAYRNGSLFIAAGLGGVKVVDVALN